MDETLNQEVQILDDEVFNDGNQFENMFGQASLAQNLRIQIVPNGYGTSENNQQPITQNQPLLSQGQATNN